VLAVFCYPLVAIAVSAKEASPALHLWPVAILRPCGRSLALGHHPRPGYSITSSARASSVGGTMRPIALAVYFLHHILPNA
jgi:hypothetical protein